MAQASLLRPTRKTDAKYLRDQVLLAEGYKDSAFSSAGTATAQAGIAADEAAAAALSEGNALTYLTETQTARDQAIAIVYGGAYSINAVAGNVPISDTDARLGNDWLHIGSGPNQIPLNQFLSSMAYQDHRHVNIAGGKVRGLSELEVASDSITITTAKTPATASATGTQGQIAWDANYIYVCTATNTWKRVAIATW